MSPVAYRYQALKEALAAAISGRGDLRRPHALAVVSGLASNGYLASLLVSRYFRLGDAGAARKGFDAAARLPSTCSAAVAPPPKTLLYNAMLRGYLAHGLPRMAVGVFAEMGACPPDRHTYHLAVEACARASEFEVGRRVGADAAAKGFASDLLVATALIGMHAEDGDIGAARVVFDEMPRRDAVAWNAVIAGYARGGNLSEAVELFIRMRSVDGVLPTEATLVSLVSGYASFGSSKGHGMMHAIVIKYGFQLNLFVCNALLDLYVAFGCLRESVMLFRQMAVKDSVTWSAMIGGLVRNGRPDSALKLFHWMLSNSTILVTRSILLNVIMACADLGEWREGRWVEERYVCCNSFEFKKDPSVVTALIYMYAKCGILDSSISLIYRVGEVRDDVIAWNAMIKGFGEFGLVEKAVGFVVEMQKIGVDPDAITYLEIIPMISSIPSLKTGMEMHAQIVRRGFLNERAIANSLISMYGRCGSLKHSIEVFSMIADKDVISWTSMMQVYAWNGHGNEVVKLYEMMKAETEPNHYTFLAVLSACKNTGLVDEGMNLIKCMQEQCGLKPAIEHISCIVDILCRAGRLTDAYHLIKYNSSEHINNEILWGTLLSASHSCGDLVIGEAAAKHLLSLDPENRVNSKMLADIYVLLGRRDDADHLLRVSMSRGLDLRPGCSWTEGV
ncbi:pentatricopeptide repeat-containing protein At4g33990-like [Oryza brachyantha]|uniref:Pentacotripeptide-repeat region of PRORP domain-containing protein n=1 Tax=Oryza brachyantha TaxID=4533 RepID=J3N996_ORYBR|nr:pentatricopeptide repeat-containing protein At4g33990-like [Oryza brachyantha]XP_015698114.1 pentatricopeptide repeat-containing protein At4g33990-like [Oryza brachyantha]XP_015698116.1 pentatricopeptide repeat-containing protein At4g33990-like [Oryza brachyantha]